MKNLKLLFTSLILVVLLLNFTNASAKPEKVIFSGTFYCYCAGEELTYEVTFNHNFNGIIEHYNAMGGKLVGTESGNVYRFIDSETYRTDGLVVVTFRFIHNGVIRTDLFIINENHQLIHSGCGN